ncbi:hypothetical protein C8F04DRAFT_1339361 [Mycena alexandri]|uniref:FAD-binding domain-containing protein n=1 Tax=Mycena alexandri TaxID=1745969 RepID=A0AAD6RZ25_9AGAR|nr:hypothetical protein C8F04DRAFT_1339361 [Mycena alexandri]
MERRICTSIADLLDMLFKLATPYMTLHLNSRVVSLKPDLARVTLTSGKTFQGDVILGADGVKSMIREVVLGRPDKPLPTGDAAYRAIVPTSEEDTRRRDRNDELELF